MWTVKSYSENIVFHCACASMPFIHDAKGAVRLRGGAGTKPHRGVGRLPKDGSLFVLIAHKSNGRVSLSPAFSVALFQPRYRILFSTLRVGY